MNFRNSASSSLSSANADSGTFLERTGGWLVVFLAVLFFYPLLFQGKVFFFFDFTYYTFPIRHFLHTMLRQGEIPFWIHTLQTGDPIMQRLLAGVCYPLSLIFLFPDFIIGLNLFYVVHFVLLGVFTWKLTRLWGCSAEAALAAAAASMFGGYALSAVVTNNLFMASCWFPMVFYSMERYWRDFTGRWFLAATVGLACMTLAGSPEPCIFTVMILTAYALVERKSIGIPSRSILFLALTMGSVVVFCLGLSMVQILPTLHLVPMSIRSGGLSFEAHAAFSANWSYVSELILPRNLYNFMTKSGFEFEDSSRLLQSLYTGFLPILGLFAVLQWKSIDRLWKFWIGVFAVGLFCALGKFNPLYKFLYETLPGLSLFRFPEKFLFLCGFALSLLTAITIDGLAGSRNFQPRTFWSGWVVLLTGIISISLWKEYRNPWPLMALMSVLAGLWFLYYRKRITSTSFRWGLLILVCLDLGIHNNPLPPIVDKGFYKKTPSLAQDIKERPKPWRIHVGTIKGEGQKFPLLPGPTLLSRQVMGAEFLLAYVGLVYGLEYAHGVQGTGMEMKDTALKYAIFAKSPVERRMRILRRFGVHYWIDVESPINFLPESENYFPIVLPSRLHTVEHPLPRAFLVGKVQTGPPVKLLNTYFAPDFDPLEEVLVETPVPLKSADSFEGTVESLEYGPNRVRLRTRQNAEGVLVLLDRYFPGWSVTVDGSPSTLFRANYFFRGVKLGPGAHTLEFRFVPEGFRTGFSITLVFVFLTLGVAASHPWLRRKILPAADSPISN